MALTLHLITPDETMTLKNLSSVILPGGDGELEILPGHISLVTTLQAGTLRREEAKEYKDLEAYQSHQQKLEIPWGIFYSQANNLTIITS